MQYIKPTWAKLKTMNLNTVLVPVYWELIEAQEGKFDFSLYQDLIVEARKNDFKIVFLWFGSWKNSMSSHAPACVKRHQDKYPRVKDNTGRSQEILSSFSENVWSDKKSNTFNHRSSRRRHNKRCFTIKANPETIVRLGKYELTCKHDYTLSWTSGSKIDDWLLASAIIIQTGEDELYVAGTGVVITFKYRDNKDLNIGLLKVDEGKFEQNRSFCAI